MTDRYIEVGGTLRRVVFEPDPGIAERVGLIWHGAFVDEIDGEPIESRVRIQSDPRLAPAADRGGRGGLVGTAAKHYPDLPGNPVAIEIRAEAVGYLPRDLTDTVTAHPDHPTAFDPATPAAAVEMQSLPVRLEGRVQRHSSAGLAPVAGATVSLNGLWPQAPQGGVIPPVDPAEVVEIRPQLTAAEAAGTVVRRVNLGTPGTDTTLAASAPSGATRLELASRAGLSPGHLIAIEPSHPDRFEIVRIDAIASLPPAPLRGQVTLSRPTAFDHLEGIAVSRRTAVAAGPVRALSRDCILGGVSLFVDAAAGLANTGFLRVDTGANAQIRRVRTYRTVTDSAGYYRLPPIHRIARAFIDAADGISALAGVPWTPRRDGPVDRLDLELPP